MHTSRLAPSMMCSNVFQLQDTLSTFEQQRIDFLHMDVMDGHFVPNITLGPDYINMLREHTSIPFDYHLMVEEPMRMLSFFDVRKGDMVAIHVEAQSHLQRALAWIQKKEAYPLAVLNPGTPINILEEVLPDLNSILLMAVNPGFAGQHMIPQVMGKIARLRRWLDDIGYPNIRIEVDGNVSFANIRQMRLSGADTFVCGTSSIFHHEDTLENNICKLKMILASIDAQAGTSHA